MQASLPTGFDVRRFAVSQAARAGEFFPERFVAGHKILPRSKLSKRLGSTAWAVYERLLSSRDVRGVSFVGRQLLAALHVDRNQQLGIARVEKALKRLVKAGLVKTIGWRKYEVRLGKKRVEKLRYLRLVYGACAGNSSSFDGVAWLVPSSTHSWFTHSPSWGGKRPGAGRKHRTFHIKSSTNIPLPQGVIHIAPYHEALRSAMAQLPENATIGPNPDTSDRLPDDWVDDYLTGPVFVQNPGSGGSISGNSSGPNTPPPGANQEGPQNIDLSSYNIASSDTLKNNGVPQTGRDSLSFFEPGDSRLTYDELVNREVAKLEAMFATLLANKAPQVSAIEQARMSAMLRNANKPAAALPPLDPGARMIGTGAGRPVNVLELRKSALVPFPGPDLVRPATLAAPPLIAAHMSAQEAVDLCALAMGCVIRDRTKARYRLWAKGVPEPKGRTDGKKLTQAQKKAQRTWGMFSRAAEAMRKEEIRPHAWIAWSWDQWVALAEKNPEMPKTPRANWVLSPTRIKDHAGWFRRAHPFEGGAMIYSPAHTELIRRYERMIVAMQTMSPSEAAEKCFPAGEFDRLLTKAKQDAADREARWNSMARNGEFLW